MTARVRAPIFVGLALLGFTSNNVLCRLALGDGALDAASFTSLRLVSGAVTLLLLVRLGSARSQTSRSEERLPAAWRSRVAGASALFVYALAFSFAYERLTAGVGALLLFGAVQVSMIG